MSEDKRREELYGSFQNRAMMYYHIYLELKDEVGEEKAAKIMGEAIKKRGLDVGKKFAEYGPDDLEGLKNAFLSFVPDDGKMFSPEVKRCDKDGLDIQFHRCPLKEAWLEAGIPEEEVAKLTAIAACVDYGTFEAAGFEFSADTYKPGDSGCCFLHIRPGKK